MVFILELCKVIVFPLYLYLCVCVCNQDLPGSKQRRPDSPIDPQTLHSPALSTSALPAHPHHPTFVCISPIFALLVYLTSGALLTQFAQYFPPSLDFALLFIVYFLSPINYIITTRLESLHTPCLQNYWILTYKFKFQQKRTKTNNIEVYAVLLLAKKSNNLLVFSD